jgi:hypothetical protein
MGMQLAKAVESALHRESELEALVRVQDGGFKSFAIAGNRVRNIVFVRPAPVAPTMSDIDLRQAF